MKWLAKLEDYNLPFSIHVLQKDDSIIISNTIQEYKIIYILDGFMQILKIFTNGEIICTQLIYKNYIIHNKIINKSENNNYYYKAIAITKTVIVIIPQNILNITVKNEHFFLKEFQTITNGNNDDITHILIYKNTKKRILHLLLLISKQFGKLKQGYIIIPFYLSHYTIATIIGSQRVTVNKIMYTLKQNKIIYYDQHQIVIYNIAELTEQ